MRRNILVGLQAASLACCLIAAPVAGAAETSTAARLQVLEDKASIQALLERYIEVNESRDFKTYSELFARDGELAFGDLRKKGPKEIFEFLDGSFGLPKNAARGPQPGSSHLLSNVRITVDGDKATSDSAIRSVMRSFSRNAANSEDQTGIV